MRSNHYILQSELTKRLLEPLSNTSTPPRPALAKRQFELPRSMPTTLISNQALYCILARGSKYPGEGDAKLLLKNWEKSLLRHYYSMVPIGSYAAFCHYSVGIVDPLKKTGRGLHQ